MAIQEGTVESLVNQGFWHKKKVLVTGHTGFKGSWLSLWLRLLGAEVIGYSLEAPTDPSHFVASGLESDIEHIIGDVRDQERLDNTIGRYRPDIVFHLAAQPLVLHSYEEPVETYEVNVIGTVRLFEAVRKVDSVRAVVIVTSDKCYENKEWCWGYREHEPLGGFDPYSSSKGCAELVVNAYRNSFFPPSDYSRHGVAIASARAGNVIGGGDWARDRLLPDLIRSVFEGKDIAIRNRGAIRPWQHVLDPLAGYLELAEMLYVHKTEYSGAWNFGPSIADCASVEYVIDKLSSLLGAEGLGGTPRATASPHEANYLKLDCSKALSLLNWRPRWNLEEALSKTVEWYEGFYRSTNDVRDMSVSQIRRYHIRMT